MSAARLLADAAAGDAIASVAVRSNEFSPVFERADGKPAEAVLSHEGKAAALWSGRIFFARGKILDARVADTRIAGEIERVAAKAPQGWTSDDTKLIHRESGLQCPAAFTLPGEDGDRLLALTAVSAYDRRNRDVSCNYAIDGDAAVTLYASYYPEMTLDDHAAGAVAAIRQNFSIRGELPVAVIEVEGESGDTLEPKLPVPLSGAFDVGDINGVPFKTAIWLAKTHGWHVKTRATYAQSDVTAEIAAAVLFGANYLNIDFKNRGDPTQPGPEV